MEEVQFKNEDNGSGVFYIKEGQDLLGEMAVSVSGNVMTVHHTEVSPQAEGKGLAKKMFGFMVDHARENKMRVVALCPFVHAQFKRNAENYKDIWQQATG